LPLSISFTSSVCRVGGSDSREDSSHIFPYFDRAALPWILRDCLFPLRIGHGVAVSPFLCQMGHFKSSDISRTFAAVLAICPIASSGPTTRSGENYSKCDKQIRTNEERFGGGLGIAKAMKTAVS